MIGHSKTPGHLKCIQVVSKKKKTNGHIRLFGTKITSILIKQRVSYEVHKENSSGVVVLPLISHAEDWLFKSSLRQAVQATKL